MGSRRAVSGALALAWLGFVTMGFNTTRLGGLAVSDLFFLCCGGVIVARLLMGRTGDLADAAMRRTSPLILFGSVLLLTMGTVSSFNSWDGMGSVQVVVRLGWLTLAWFWILRAVCRDRFALARIVGGWRIGVLITAGVGVAGDLGLLHVGVANAEGRQTAFFAQPNEFAAMLAIALPLFVLDAPGPDADLQGSRRTTLRFGFIAFIVWGIASSGSMTGTISAALGSATTLLVLALTKGRISARGRRNPLAPFIAVVAVVAGIFVLSTSDLPVVERFTRLESGDSYIQSSVQTREDRNSEAIQKLPNTIVSGTGLQLQGDAATRVGASSHGTDPDAVIAIHNMYLKVAHEAGVPALIGLLMMLLTAYRQAWRLAVNTRGTPLHRLSAGFLGALAAASCQAMFHPIVYQRYFWVTIAMITCLWSVRRGELRAAAHAAATA